MPSHCILECTTRTLTVRSGVVRTRSKMFSTKTWRTWWTTSLYDTKTCDWQGVCGGRYAHTTSNHDNDMKLTLLIIWTLFGHLSISSQGITTCQKIRHTLWVLTYLITVQTNHRNNNADGWENEHVKFRQNNMHILHAICTLYYTRSGNTHDQIRSSPPGSVFMRITPRPIFELGYSRRT